MNNWLGFEKLNIYVLCIGIIICFEKCSLLVKTKNVLPAFFKSYWLPFPQILIKGCYGCKESILKHENIKNDDFLDQQHIWPKTSLSNTIYCKMLTPLNHYLLFFRLFFYLYILSYAAVSHMHHLRYASRPTSSERQKY